MHLKGWGVKADRQRAFYYFNMASHAGHVLAQYNAAMMQLSSDPSASSCSKALAMLKQVAERGPVAVALQVTPSCLCSLIQLPFAMLESPHTCVRLFHPTHMAPAIPHAQFR